MAESVIEAFEVIEDKEQDGDGLFCAASQLQFSFERLLQKPPIEKASQWIANRLFTLNLNRIP